LFQTANIEILKRPNQKSSDPPGSRFLRTSKLLVPSLVQKLLQMAMGIVKSALMVAYNGAFTRHKIFVFASALGSLKRGSSTWALGIGTRTVWMQWSRYSMQTLGFLVTLHSQSAMGGFKTRLAGREKHFFRGIASFTALRKWTAVMSP